MKKPILAGPRLQVRNGRRMTILDESSSPATRYVQSYVPSTMTSVSAVRGPDQFTLFNLLCVLGTLLSMALNAAMFYKLFYSNNSWILSLFYCCSTCLLIDEKIFILLWSVSSFVFQQWFLCSSVHSFPSSPFDLHIRPTHLIKFLSWVWQYVKLVKCWNMVKLVIIYDTRNRNDRRKDGMRLPAYILGLLKLFTHFTNNAKQRIFEKYVFLDFSKVVLLSFFEPAQKCWRVATCSKDTGSRKWGEWDATQWKDN